MWRISLRILLALAVLFLGVFHWALAVVACIVLMFALSYWIECIIIALALGAMYGVFSGKLLLLILITALLLVFVEYSKQHLLLLRR